MNTPRILVVGGGMAGLLLALLLRRAGQSQVTLIEASPLEAASLDTPSFDARSTALSAGTLDIFNALGLAGTLLGGCADIGSVQVSRRGRLGTATLTAQEHGLPRLGAVTENRWLGKVLLDASLADPGIVLRAPAQLTRLTRTEQGWHAVTSDGDELDCDLLAAADGAGSRTRDWLGISAHHQDTGHCALIANVLPDRAHDDIARERFLDDGPLALLPLPDNRLALVWTGPKPQVDALMALDDGAFAQSLTEQVRPAFERFSRIGQRAMYPLVLTRACAQAVPHAVVVGNAAHSLHPVAGQGFNLTVRDLAALAETLGDCRDPGRLDRLNAWAAARAADQALISGASRWLPELFRVTFGPFAHTRQLGLLALALLPGLRQDFARRAMGLGHG